MDKLFKNCVLIVALWFKNTHFFNFFRFFNFSFSLDLLLFNFFPTNIEQLFAPKFTLPYCGKNCFYTYSTPTTATTILIYKVLVKFVKL
jgi:hypothetical protein